MLRADHVPALLAGGLVLVLGFDEGGFSPATWVWSVVPLAIVAGSLLSGQARRPSPLELGFHAAHAGQHGWTHVSTN